MTLGFGDAKDLDSRRGCSIVRLSHWKEQTWENEAHVWVCRRPAGQTQRFYRGK